MASSSHILVRIYCVTWYCIETIVSTVHHDHRVVLHRDPDFLTSMERHAPLRYVSHVTTKYRHHCWGGSGDPEWGFTFKVIHGYTFSNCLISQLRKPTNLLEIYIERSIPLLVVYKCTGSVCLEIRIYPTFLMSSVFRQTFQLVFTNFSLSRGFIFQNPIA